jgi:hypothetical protein
MASYIERRKFLATLGGAVAWPLAVRAQQGERARRIGVLMNLAADNREAQARIAAFLQGLQQLGWTDGGNVRIDYRWAAGDLLVFRDTPRSFWRSRRTLFWPRPSQAFKHCSGRPAPCPSCSRRSVIRSPPASSKAWHGRVATPQALCSSSSA